MPAILATLLSLPKWAYWVAGTVALVGGFLLWLHFHDNDVRKEDREHAAVVVGQKTLEAERTANANDAERQAENRTNDALTRKAIDDAAAKDPEAAKAPAGPAARAAADSLRKRTPRPSSPTH